jgi:hypothetical protein
MVETEVEAKAIMLLRCQLLRTTEVADLVLNIHSTIKR